MEEKGKKEKNKSMKWKSDPKFSSQKHEDIDCTADAYAATTSVCGSKERMPAREMNFCDTSRKSSISLSHFVHQAGVHHISSTDSLLAASNAKTRCQANVWNSRQGTIDDGSDEPALKLRQWVTTSR